MNRKEVPAAPWWGIALALNACLWVGFLNGKAEGIQEGLQAASSTDYLPPRVVLGDSGAFLAGFAACRNTYQIGADDAELD